MIEIRHSMIQTGFPQCVSMMVPCQFLDTPWGMVVWIAQVAILKSSLSDTAQFDLSNRFNLIQRGVFESTRSEEVTENRYPIKVTEEWEVNGNRPLLKEDVHPILNEKLI